MISSFTRCHYKQIVLCLLACFTIALCGCSSSTVKQTSNEGNVYDRIMRQGKIRCGYVVYNPGCLKDPNTGKLTGIGIEALELAAKNLGLEIEWTEETGWGTMIEGLETNRYDLVATPIWTNSNRARIVDFAKPLYYSPLFVYVKSGDKRFNGDKLSSLNSPEHSISCMDGETAQIVAKEDFPQAKTVCLTQLSDASQLLLNVSTGKADATIAEPAVAEEFLKHNPKSIEQTVSTQPIRVFPNCWMFRRGQLELKDMLNTALDQLVNSGAVDRIIKKYEQVPNTLYRVALPYQQPSQAKAK